MKLTSNKACELADFRDPELRRWITEIFAHEIERFGPSFPDGVEYRKHWEVAMTAMALSRAGLLNDHAEVLGIGAGNEPTLFWLTNHVGRVFATDIYLDAGNWKQSAHTSMLASPESHWPFAWRPRRLVVQHMDALDLRYEPASFDAIFSSSSLEHFGDRDAIVRAIAEMHRVLKPGGVLCLSTELRLRGPGPGLPGILMFSEEDIAELIIGDGLWEPLDPPDLSVSAETLEQAHDFSRYATDIKRHVKREKHLVFHRLDWSKYPHIVLREGDRWWTSVHLALRRI
ncbi:MAG TPA: class I SAM-dependent methyltransferase [Solirubrobacteraceae bacterium]